MRHGTVYIGFVPAMAIATASLKTTKSSLWTKGRFLTLGLLPVRLITEGNAACRA